MNGKNIPFGNVKDSDTRLYGKMAYFPWQSVTKFTVRILSHSAHRSLCLWLLSSAVSAIFALPELVIPEQLNQTLNLSEVFEHLPDSSEKIPFGKKFEPNRGITVHHAFRQAPIWFHFRYRYAVESAAEALLTLGNYTFVRVDFYVVENGRVTTERHTGAIRPFESRYLNLRDFTFPLPISTENTDVYVQIQSSTPLNFTPRLRSAAETLKKENTDQIVGGLLFGAQAILILYNFFLFLSLRDRSYLFYSMYITGWLLFETKTTGFLARYILYDAPMVDVLILPCIVFFTLAAFVLFTEQFLYAENSPGPHRYIRRIAAAVVILSPGIVFLPQHLMIPAGIPLNLIVTAYVGWRSFAAWRARKPSAGYFLLAVFCSILLLPVFALTRIIPVTAGFTLLHFIFNYGVPMILLAEALLLSFALADRYRRLREEKEQQEAEFSGMLDSEKARINAELHDVIGSDLSLMRFSLLNARKKPKPGELEAKLDKTLLRLRELVALNNIDRGLPSRLTHELDARAREFSAATGMKLNATIDEIPLSVLEAFHVQRFFAEALTNAARHSGGKKLTVLFKRRKSGVLLLVGDDGRGIAARRRETGEGSGLRNFAERARRLNARFRIFSRPGKGTAVALLLNNYAEK